MLYSLWGEGWARGHMTVIPWCLSKPQPAARNAKDVSVWHASFPETGILSQQITSSEGMLSACTCSTSPATSTENIPSKSSVLHTWKRISSDQCNSSPLERICIKSYLDMSTDREALYKTLLCDKKSKWPLSSLSYCSRLSPCLFPRHSFILQKSWVYSALPPLTHAEVCGRQVFGKNSSILVKVSEKKGECVFIHYYQSQRRQKSFLFHPHRALPQAIEEELPHMTDLFPHSCSHLKLRSPLYFPKGRNIPTCWCVWRLFSLPDQIYI